MGIKKKIVAIIRHYSPELTPLAIWLQWNAVSRYVGSIICPLVCFFWLPSLPFPSHLGLATARDIVILCSAAKEKLQRQFQDPFCRHVLCSHFPEAVYVFAVGKCLLSICRQKSVRNVTAIEDFSTHKENFNITSLHNK